MAKRKSKAKSTARDRTKLRKIAKSTTFKGKPAVTGHVDLMTRQMRELDKDPGNLLLRRILAKTTEGLAQIIRDGGSYIAANHKRKRAT